MDYCIVLTTCSNIDESKKIAHKLIEKKLAACVNIIPKIISIYNWQEKINEDEEYLLVIKTKNTLFESIKQTILSLHSYELPEIIMIPIKNGLQDYLQWIAKETVEK